MICSTHRLLFLELPEPFTALLLALLRLISLLMLRLQLQLRLCMRRLGSWRETAGPGGNIFRQRGRVG